MKKYIKICINKNYFSPLAETIRNGIVGLIIISRTRAEDMKNRGSTPARIINFSSSLDYPVRLFGHLNSYSNGTGGSLWV